MSPRSRNSAICMSVAPAEGDRGAREAIEHVPRSHRPHHAAGDQRRPADHRRGDGPRALPHVVLLDHPRIAGPRRRLVRHRFQHAVRIGIDAAAYRLAARLSRRHPATRCRAANGTRAISSSTTIPITARAIRRTSPSWCRFFTKETLVGFSANTAHHLDIGAATPGLIIDIPDVFAEGMLFAGTKLYERGKRNEALWEYHRPQQPRRAPAAGRSRRADRLGAARRQALRRADATATGGRPCSTRRSS